MKKLFLSVVIATLFFTIVSSARAADTKRPPIEYGYPDVSVWTTERDSDGLLKNPLLKLADVMFKEAGIEWRSTAYPAKRLFKHLKEGVTPFTMLVRAPSLQECCLFSENPVTSTELRVYRRPGTPQISSQKDLAGKKVITIRGYSYGGLGRFIRDEKNGVAIQEATNHMAAFQLFERNRGDYIIDYTGPAEEVLAKNPVGSIAYDVLTRLDVFLVLSKDYPDASNLLKKLEKIVAGLDASEILKAK